MFHLQPISPEVIEIVKTALTGLVELIEGSVKASVDVSFLLLCALGIYLMILLDSTDPAGVLQSEKFHAELSTTLIALVQRVATYLSKSTLSPELASLVQSFAKSIVQTPRDFRFAFNCCFNRI